jgi:hypothetical protein
MPPPRSTPIASTGQHSAYNRNNIFGVRTYISNVIASGIHPHPQGKGVSLSPQELTFLTTPSRGAKWPAE